MNKLSSTLLPAMVLAFALPACVTINVYFPAAAAEKAADRIIDEVWGEQGQSSGQSPPPRSGSSSRAPSALLDRMVGAVLRAAVPAAHAQAPDLDISSPAIQKLRDDMRRRHEQLLPYYESGAIGLTREGLVALRSAKAVPLKERKTVNQLLAAENQDRNALYREIARANGHPEWEPDIRSTFARRWVERAPRGWWYELGQGWKRR